VSVAALVGLVLVGMVAGLDLVSVLQGLLSRPLVVATAAGVLLGDVQSGLRIGAVLELFALDVIPVGASRYPDFGAATVGAVIAAGGTSWTSALGAAVGFGLVFAVGAGATIPVIRRLNARTIRALGQGLVEGDPRVVEAVHLRCLGHDVVRSLGLSVVAVSAGWILAGPVARLDPGTGWWLTALALGGGVWAVTHGATVAGRTGARWRWGMVGLIVGLMLVVP
jgi:mannose/fructose/N-acetylgalactosamine-specific phosphotransferase system component IIC